MINKKITESASRRDFLKKAALSSSAMLKLPMVGSSLLWANSAFAASAPRRVIFVYAPGGAVPDLWIPKNDFILPTMSAPLESVKQHCLFLKGVNMDNPGHGLTSKALVANNNTNSLDMYLARSAIGEATSFSQLQLGVLTNGFDTISRYNWQQPPFEDSPMNAFERLFGAGAAASSSEDIVTRQKRSVLDASLEAFNQMRSKLGSFEQSRLDEHADAIRRIEKRLTATQPAAEGGVCTSPSFNQDGFNGEIADSANFDALADLQSDVITLALKCDLTRTVSFMLGNQQGDFVVPESGVDTNFHQSVHGRPVEDYAKFRAYFTKKLAYLVKKLANTEDMDGNSLLDNTIILTVADMADARAHSGEDVPYAFIGGANLGMKGGRVLDLGGISYGDVLDTVAQAMGVNVNGSDYILHGKGPISGIFS
jgi:hypothetical protein